MTTEGFWVLIACAIVLALAVGFDIWFEQKYKIKEEEEQDKKGDPWAL